jgi:hypothetical protein
MAEFSKKKIPNSSSAKDTTMKSYTLNIRKFKDMVYEAKREPHEITVTIKDKGKVVVMVFSNSDHFKIFQVNAITFYKDRDAKIEPRTDEMKVHVEDKIVTKQGVTLHLYDTQLKIMAQGDADKLLKWMENDFENVCKMAKIKTENENLAETKTENENLAEIKTENENLDPNDLKLEALSFN